MNYKTLIFAALMAVGFMSHGTEAPKAQNSSRWNSSFPWIMGGASILTLKAGYHWCKHMYCTAYGQNEHVTCISLSTLQNFDPGENNSQFRFNRTKREMNASVQDSIDDETVRVKKRYQEQADEQKKKFWFTLKCSALCAGGLSLYLHANTRDK